MNNKIVCITGGTGFIGKKLIELIGDEWEIRVLTRQKDLRSPRKNIHYVYGDLLDKSSLEELIAEGSIVINLTYLSHAGEEANLTVTRNLVSLVAEKKAGRFVHCSTAVVVGEVNQKVITETTECNPITEYERCKYNVEQIIHEALRNKSQYTILRPTAVFGEGGKNLLRQADELYYEQNWKIFFRTVICSVRHLNLVAVENVVAALWFLATTEKKVDGECYIVSDDEFPQNEYKETIRFLAKKFNKNILVSPFHLPLFLYKFLTKLIGKSVIHPARCFRADKLLKLGYKKRISYDAGLVSFCTWYLKQKQDG